MKKKTKAKASKKRVPFICVIKGEGIDVNVKLEGKTPDFSGLAGALRNAIQPPPFVEGSMPPSMTLREEIAIYLSSLDGDELVIAGEVLAAEISRRAQGNGSTTAKPEATAEA